MGGNITAFLAKNSSAMGGNILRMARVVKREIGTEVAAQFKVLSSLAEASDRVVGASLAFAARSCAERTQAGPTTSSPLPPRPFLRATIPRLGVRRQHLPRLVNRFSWWLARRLDNWLLRAAINRGRTLPGPARHHGCARPFHLARPQLARD
jgi:hypothetical protein